MKVVLFCGGLGMRMRSWERRTIAKADDANRHKAGFMAHHALLCTLRA